MKHNPNQQKTDADSGNSVRFCFYHCKTGILSHWEQSPFRSREQRRAFGKMGEHRPIQPKGSARGGSPPHEKKNRPHPATADGDGFRFWSKKLTFGKGIGEN